MITHLTYDGKKITWKGKGVYNATSGLMEFVDENGNGVIDDWRYADFQRKKDHGPIPEGRYYLYLKEDKNPVAAHNLAKCQLYGSPKLQRIPRGAKYGECDLYWANWGENRIRLQPYSSTKTFNRSGFYLHDSTKGYTHGCVELDQAFFRELRKFIRANSALPKSKRRYRLNLLVTYPKIREFTYGGTLVP